MYTIYGLIDPRSYAVRYIGVTAHHPAVRLREHLKEAVSGKNTTLKIWWLSELRDLGLEPDVVCLEYEANAALAQEKERQWMEIAATMKWPLTNNASYGSAIEKVIARQKSESTRHRTPINVDSSAPVVASANAAEVKAAIFAHLDANPDATQAEIRATLGSSRAWTNACWHEWHNQDGD